MQIYRITRREDDDFPVYVGTAAEAHTAMKASPFPESATATLIDVQVDKEGVLALLNRQPIFKPLRTYILTKRGAMKEIDA